MSRVYDFGLGGQFPDSSTKFLLYPNNPIFCRIIGIACFWTRHFWDSVPKCLEHRLFRRFPAWRQPQPWRRERDQSLIEASVSLDGLLMKPSRQATPWVPPAACHVAPATGHVAPASTQSSFLVPCADVFPGSPPSSGMRGRPNPLQRRFALSAA